MRFAISLSLVAFFVAACSSDSGDNNDQPDDTSDAGVIADSGHTGDSGGPGDSGNSGDAETPVTCTQVSVVGPWNLTLADDVSIEYSAAITPDIEGDERVVSVLFERYSPGPDVGTFDLSAEPDDNFGTCPHCTFVRTDGPERAYFQAEGLLEARSDPYGRRPDFTISGLKLVEVEVDGATRSSTPIPGGACLEFEDFDVEGVFPPTSWTCPPQAYNDDTNCNCACGAVDPDCGLQSDCVLGDPNCPEPFELPVLGCEAEQVCAFDPASFDNECYEACDWRAQVGCTTGTCVFDSGGNGADLCITDPLRVAPALGVGDECPDTPFQVVCNVSNGFAQGYCGPNGICRSLCESNDECTEDGHTCRTFAFGDPLGYCGPEPVDPEG